MASKMATRQRDVMMIVPGFIMLDRAHCGVLGLYIAPLFQCAEGQFRFRWRGPVENLQYERADVLHIITAHGVNWCSFPDAPGAVSFPCRRSAVAALNILNKHRSAAN